MSAVIHKTQKVASNVQRKLIILDLDGVLWERSGKRASFNPGIKKFIRECYKIANVGFFTSSTQKNVEEPLRRLLTRQQWQRTIFRWYRPQCTLSPTPEKPWATVKKLDNVLAAFPYYQNSAIAMVDDSPTKMVCNPVANVVIRKPGQPLSELMEDIKACLAKQ